MIVIDSDGTHGGHLDADDKLHVHKPTGTETLILMGSKPEPVRVTVAEVDKVIHDVVAERPSKVYKAPNMLYRDDDRENWVSACVYVERDENELHPSCLIGHVLWRLGVPLDEMDVDANTGVGSLVSDLHANKVLEIEGLPNEVETLLEALRVAQSIQDLAYPWRDALEEYEKVMPAHQDYPHEWGYLIGCPGCESRCWCAPGHAECVFTGGTHKGGGE